MRKIWKKTLAYLLAATMCFSVVSVPAFAQGSNVAETATEIDTEDVFEHENYRITFTLTSY